MSTIITYIIFISAILLVASILLQNRGTGLSNVLGGDSESFYTRRGFDKVLYTSTIVLAIIFAGAVLAKSIVS